MGQTGKGEDEMIHPLSNSKIQGGDEEDIDVQSIWCKEKKPVAYIIKLACR